MARTGRRRGAFASRRWVSAAALACVAIILVSVNVVASRFFAVRADLTADHLFTLSRGTRATLAAIAEPITLRFYYSQRLGEAVPSYGVYAGQVREMLDQYVIAARGRIRLEVYNPAPFSSVEDQAVGFGLQGVPLNRQGEQVYFGLAGTNSTDDIQVIPFFSPDRERFLEYDLTRLVHTLAFPKRVVVGLLSSLPLDGGAASPGGAGQPMAVMDQLRQLDDVRDLDPGLAAIPKGVDVLMLVQPQHLSPQTLFAIDQFVLKGGKALVFVDPYSELQGSLPGVADNPHADTASNLEPLFNAWGVRMVPNVVAGDRNDARRVGVPVPGHGVEPMDYVAWLAVRPPDLNRNNMITADLKRVNLASAGILESVAGAKTKLVPLITTTGDSTEIPVAKVKGLPDVADLLARFHPTGRHYTLAAQITGPAATAFPEGPPKPAGKPAPGGFVKVSAKPIDVVVVADTDLLDDRFWAQSQDFFGREEVVPDAGNGDFVANAIEVLSGGDDLIGLRSRGSAARPFLVVERIQRSADDEYAARQQELQQKLTATEAKLRTLTGGDNGAVPATLSPAEMKTIAQFRADMVTTREQLRAVQWDLRRDISRLKTILEFIDIALIPIVVAAAAIVLGALRARRRRRSAPV